MKHLSLCIFVFLSGFLLGHLDAKYGSEIGLKYGEASRKFLIEHGFLRDKPHE